MRAWDEFLAVQEKELGKETVEKWLRPLTIVRFDACNLYLEAQDSFKALWFEEHMRSRVQKKLLNNNNKQIKVHIAVSHNNQEEAAPRPLKKKAPSSLTSLSFQLRFDEIDPNATFDRFITSNSNLLAFKLLHETVRDVQMGNALQFNPIYLYGRAGTGKTHLLMATAAALKGMGIRSLYIRADTFTDHVVGAIRSAEMQAFRKAYRGVQALLIDDIEVFSRKAATQEEFFHTFNTLHVEGKQIILSASLPPQELKFIEQRLVSRFEWGIVLPLHIQSREQLCAILLQQAAKVDFPLEEVVIQFFLDTFGSSAKTMLRAFDALVLRTHLNQGLGKVSSLPLSLSVVQFTLKDLIHEEEKSLLTPGKIIRIVADHYGIRIDDILSKSQARECALPRQIAMHLCREELGLPFMKIGDIFSRDHSTVMASVKQIQKGLETKNHEIAGSIGAILKQLER